MEIIKKQLTKLLDLVEKYPVKMPLSVVAEFLEMNEAGLKAGLMRGNIPFGFAYQKDDGGYRVNVIPTVKFYLWYTNTTGQMLLATD
jgi:hypothetical protein